MVDREWTIDAYNLRIYAPTNGDNMLAVYSSGGNGFPTGSTIHWYL